MQINLFKLGQEEQASKPSETKNVSPKQSKDAFNCLYIRKDKLGTPFKVNFCISLARDIMQAQKVNFIPLSVIIAVASEFRLDLSMQSRKAKSQIRAQCKKLNIGSFADTDISQGKGAKKQTTQLEVLTLHKEAIKKLDTCSYSVLT